MWSPLDRGGRKPNAGRRLRGVEALEGRLMLSADSTVVFNEIMYHADGDSDGLEWVELTNQMDVDMDLSGWSLDEAVDYRFAEGTVLPGGGFLVVAEDPVALEAAVGFGEALGPYTGKLSNGGERLILRDNNDRLLDELRYDDDEPWPAAPDGSGVSLAKYQELTPSGPAANWRPSAQIAGTPGQINFPDNTGPPVDEALVINEIAPALEQPFWLELYNHGNTPIDMAGHILRSSTGGEYTFPSGETLVEGEYLVVDESRLGFRIPADEKLFLYAPHETSVLDAVGVKNTLRGRTADAPTGALLTPEVATPGTANSFVFHDQIVINEIMYHFRPELGEAFEENPEEWIELINRSEETIGLDGWSFADAIDYEFPVGTSIGPGAYLVVANDATALRNIYPDIQIVGDFSRSLSNRTDRIVLLDASGNPADEVTYHDDRPWPKFADGGGSSLELRNPLIDNGVAEAWAPSDEAAKSTWQHYTYTMTAVQPVYSPPINNFHELRMGLLNGGEVLIDNVTVIESPRRSPRQLIQNGTFSAGTSKWRLTGTHSHSQVIPDPDDSRNRVLHLVATGPTSYLSNRTETTLKYGGSIVPVVTGQEYQISFDARWLGGSRQLHTELYYNKVVRTTILDVPQHHGTPGAENSTFQQNTGPTYRGAIHSPAVPRQGQRTTVSVEANDPDGIDSLTLHYRAGTAAWRSIPMAPQGGETRTGKLYQGVISGQYAAAVLQFYIEGKDQLGAISTYPAAGINSRALIKIDDGRAAAGRQNLRIIMTAADSTLMHDSLNILSNDRIGATIVYNESEIFYDAGIRLRGSMYSRRNAGSTGFNIKFPADHLFRGIHETVTVKRTRLQEILVKHMNNHAGDIPGGYDDIVHLVSHRTDNRGPARLSMARYNDIYLDSQFENGSDGGLFKMEGIRVVQGTSNGDPEGTKKPFPIGWVSSYDLRDLAYGEEQYRWSILINNNRARDDYSAIVALTKALTLTGTALEEAVAEVMDVDQWARVFAMESLAGIGDTYTQGNPHNADFYVRPEDGKILTLPWDWDFTFNRSTSSPLWGNKNLAKVFARPIYSRLFHGHLYDLIDTTFNRTYMTPWMQHYGQLAGANFPSYLPYIDARSNYVLGRLPGRFPFQLITNGGDDLSTTDRVVTLQGEGWIDVREIRLAGESEPLKVTWLDARRWEIDVPLDPGANSLSFGAFDHQGRRVGADTMTVTSTDPDRPLYDALRITELNYHPADPTAAEQAAGFDDADDFEFIELRNVGPDPLDLAGAGFIDAIAFEFTGTVESGQIIVVAKDPDALAARYGSELAGVDLLGPYGGHLSNGGERLILATRFGLPILDFTYDDSGLWPGRADGNGSSLEILDPTADYDDPANWRSSSEFGGSPGTSGSGPRRDVWINEVLSNTDLEKTDAVELHNATTQDIDIGGWYLSDSSDDYRKFRIPDETILSAGRYLVFNESQFNPEPAGTGFALSGAHGDDVWLLEADSAGQLRSFVDHVEFGAAANGESLGRWPNGEGPLYPMKRPTLGGANIGPRVGPVIVSEVMYDPDPPAGKVAEEFEFIEIHNPTAEVVDLSGWRIRGTIGFEFPSDVEMAPGESIVVVPFDPADGSKIGAFRNHYGMDPSVTILGGHNDPLDDLGGRITLQRPDESPPDEPDFIPYLLEDEIVYAAANPWPSGPAGEGRTLSRRAAVLWGNDVASWIAAEPTPGQFDAGLHPGDANLDSTTDVRDFMIWNTHKFTSGTNWTTGDFNLDGITDVRDFMIWNAHKFTSAPAPPPALARAVDGVFDAETTSPAELAWLGEWFESEFASTKDDRAEKSEEAADRVLASYW